MSYIIHADCIEAMAAYLQLSHSRDMIGITIIGGGIMGKPFEAGHIPWNKGKSYERMKGNQHAKGHAPNATVFRAGNIPWNKGRTGIHLSPATEFKKGQESPREMFIGSITLRRTKGGKTRRFIKTETRWIEYAKWLWQKTYGHLLPGDVVHHLNGDVLDDRLGNLIAMPRSHHPGFHGRWGLYLVDDTRLALYHQRYRERKNS